MKFYSKLLILSLLVGAAEARLFGKRAKSSKEKPSGRHDQEQRQVPGSPASPSMKQPKSIKKSSTTVRTEEVIEEDPEVHRNTNQVRITLVDVEDISTMSSSETIFFEDSFMSAFVEAQDSGDDDVHVRSMIVLSDSSAENNRLRRRDRSLWRTPGKYFDIAALFEWSCRFCTARRSSTNDDDHTDDDFYFKGAAEKSPSASPSSSPTASPTATPTDFWLDDDHTDDDFYFSGKALDGSETTTAQPDDYRYGYTDDIFYFMGSTSPANDEPDDDWALGGALADDDIFSFLFGGKRFLKESDERRLERLLCSKLRDGPYPAFHHVKECFVVFAE